MKLSKRCVAFLLALSLLVVFLSPLAAKAQVTFPARGGTGTSTIPSYGQVLVGNGAGIYAPTATSSLGITADVSVTYPLQASGGVVSLLFGTTTANSWSLQNTFASLFATNASSTSATSTNLAVTGAFNFLGTTITNVSTWFNGLFDTRLATKTTADLPEGANLYFTGDRVASVIAGTTTTALAEGSNLYFTNARADARINATSTLGTLLSAPNLATVGTISSGVWQGTAIGDSYLTKSGNWTGTFDGQEGSYYLDRANHSGSQLASTISDFASSVAGIIAGTTTDAVDEGSSNLYFTNARARGAISLTTTGTTGAATYDSGTGVLNVPQYAGTTYTATYPVTLTGTAFGLGFGTTSSNTWAGTQTFTNSPVLGTLTGLVKAASGVLSAATAGTDYLVPSGALTAGSVLFGDGSGQAAQDNANLFFDNTQNNLGIGQTVPWARLEATATSTAGTTTATGYGVSGSQIRLGSVAEAITVNELLGGIDFVSNDTSLTGGRLVTASIQVQAAGTHTGVSVPSDLVFYTAPASSVPTEKLRITSTGIGVGTSTPFGRFAITSNGTGADTRGFTVANVNNVAVFSVGDTGETAIGTTTDLSSNFAFGVQLSDSATGAGDNTARFIHGDAGQTGAGVVIGSVRAASSAYPFLTIQSDYDGTPVEAFTFRGDGNLGIGSSSPLYDLSLAAGANNATKDIKAFFGRGDSAVGTVIGTGDGTTNSGFIGTLQNYPFYFVTNNAEIARFTAAGNFGIGTTSAYARLSVAQASTTDAFVVGTAGSTTPSFIVKAANSNGNVGVATTSPYSKLSVGGTFAADVGLEQAFAVDSSGVVTLPHALATGFAYLQAPSGRGFRFLSGSATTLVSFPASTASTLVLGYAALQIGDTSGAGTSIYLNSIGASDLNLRAGDGNVSRTADVIFSVKDNQEVARFTDTLMLGIGTTSPYAKLSVVGQAVAAYFTATTTSTNTFPNLSSTNATTTGAVNLGSFTSALLQTDGDGDVGEYAGTACTNQFVRSLSALGVATCATVANTDLANSTISGIALGSNLADLTATNSTLTFSGTYNGGTARSIGLNLGNANTWTALQTFAGNGTTTFAGGIQGGTLVAGPYFHATSSTATSTFSGGLRGTAAYFSGLIESVGGVLGTGTWNLSGATVKQKTYPSLTWPAGTATTTTATTTVPIGQAMNPQLFNRGSCRATSGTSGYRIGDGTNWSNYIVATSTAGNYAFTSNNSFVLDENKVMEVGPLTNAQITCGFDITVNN